MSDQRPGAWLAGVILGFISGPALFVLGVYGMIFMLACIALIAWKGPRLLAGAGLITGVGLVFTVLFARVALTCGGPLDPGTSSCVAGDLGGWIAGSAAIFAVGLVASAVALRRANR